MIFQMTTHLMYCQLIAIVQKIGLLGFYLYINMKLGTHTLEAIPTT